MRIVVLFAPGFLAFGKAFLKCLEAENPDLEVMAFAATKKTYDALIADRPQSFKVVECLETREREWLEQPYDQARLQRYEDLLGVKAVGDILIADRLVGSGYVSCANPVKTELTARTMDHDHMRAYMANMMEYFETMFDEHKPDTAFIYAIAGAISSAMVRIMEAKNIHVYKLQHTRIEDRFIVDTSLMGLLDPIWKRYLKGEKGQGEALEKAHAWLDEFRAQDKKPDYFIYNIQRTKQMLQPGTIAKDMSLSFLRWMYYVVFPDRKQLRSENGGHRFFESFMVPLRAYRATLPSFYSDYDALKDQDFICFPLHVDPESSTMHLAPDYTDQVAVIEMLAKRRPLHMNILVKEHPNMIGRRPAGFYERIRQLPGVYLINPAVASAVMIKDARLVATITGTVAWEAMAHGRQVLVLGNFPFLSFATEVGKGAVPGSYDTLAEDIEAALQVEPVSADEIVRLLSLLFEESFPMSATLFWGEISDDVMEQNMSMVERMARKFLERLKGDKLPASSAA